MRLAISAAVFVCRVIGSFAGEQPEETYAVCGVITGFASGKTIFISIYDSQRGFSRTEFIKGQHFDGEDLAPDSVSYCFDSISPGYYMIAAFQDVNGDTTMNTGWFGRPVEPYTIYRPFAGIFAPSFSACRFLVEGDYDSAHLSF